MILHLATIRGISLSMECIESPLGESSKPPPKSTTQCSRRFLGIIDRDPSVPKPKELHVDVYRFFIVKLRNILQTPINRSAITFLKSSTSTDNFSNSTRSSVICTRSRFSAFIATTPPKLVHLPIDLIHPNYPSSKKIKTNH